MRTAVIALRTLIALFLLLVLSSDHSPIVSGEETRVAPPALQTWRLKLPEDACDEGELCSMAVREVRFTGDGGREYRLEVWVADAPGERAGGFQHVSGDAIVRGAMLFLFPSPIQGAFHMCNVEEPLWIMWFRPDGTLLDVRQMLPGRKVHPALCADLYAPRTAEPYQFAVELGEEAARAMIEEALGGSLSRLDTLRTTGLRLHIEPWMRHDVPQPRLQPVATGLQQPLQVTYIPDEPSALVIVEKVGRVRLMVDGALLTRPLLDLRSRVSRGFEQGLLSIAFHPDFQRNRSFFVNYTDLRGDTVVARYRMADGEWEADPASETILMRIAQPAANHNGGMMRFGPDGYLYIATGDGGRAGDPWQNAQNLQTLLGKLLRIDVDGGEPYAIPADNPFVGRADAREEIWAYGLRNPWQFAFDRATGDLYIADVGQSRWEEVNVQWAGTGAGANYGWNSMEGFSCYRLGCDPTHMTLPALVYGHDAAGGCSITGGTVYRGSALPELYGAYIFSDYCSGTIWMSWPERRARQPSSLNESWPFRVLLPTSFQVSSFGEDFDGELYVTDIAGGGVYRLTP